MESIEIVITPRVIERVIYSTVILILLVLVIVNLGGEKCVVPVDEQAGSQVLQTTNQTATVPMQSADACSNGVKDSSETDVDCGGNCEGCDEYLACNVDDDCAENLYCFQHIKCLKATCEDGLKNQNETNIDCGGVCGGYWWSDQTCHDTAEPSGRLTIKLSVDAEESALSGNVILNKITMNLENGLSKSVALSAAIYALDEKGAYIHQDRDGNPIAIESVILDSIPSAGKLTETVNLNESTRRTLTGVTMDDQFKILVEFEDGEGNLVERNTWTNP